LVLDYLKDIEKLLTEWYENFTRTI
jgi:hypothetical protein